MRCRAAVCMCSLQAFMLWRVLGDLVRACFVTNVTTSQLQEQWEGGGERKRTKHVFISVFHLFYKNGMLTNVYVPTLVFHTVPT